MRSLEVSVSDETARSLAVEADLLQFEDVQAYVEWILSHRLHLSVDDRRGALLTAYADRVGDLDLNPDEAADVVAAARRATSDRAIEGEVRPDVDRVEDESLGETAAALSSVEAGRFDELVSRAVTETRERLGDGVGTGIEYSSRRRLDDAATPGADVADLGSIEVPGYDDELIERRRRAVGAALAYLKDAEAARRSDFVDELYDDYPAGYESADGWWGCVKRGLRQVDRVRPAHEGRRVWRYRTTPGRVTRISYS